MLQHKISVCSRTMIFEGENMYEDIHEQIMDLIMEQDPAAAVPEDLHQQCLDMLNASFPP